MAQKRSASRSLRAAHVIEPNFAVPQHHELVALVHLIVSADVEEEDLDRRLDMDTRISPVTEKALHAP
jgi:hypothetical protein